MDLDKKQNLEGHHREVDKKMICTQHMLIVRRSPDAFSQRILQSLTAQFRNVVGFPFRILNKKIDAGVDFTVLFLLLFNLGVPL